MGGRQGGFLRRGLQRWKPQFPATGSGRVEPPACCAHGCVEVVKHLHLQPKLRRRSPTCLSLREKESDTCRFFRSNKKTRLSDICILDQQDNSMCECLPEPY